MTEQENPNNSIISIGSTGLVRVGNSIDITNKIIQEHEERSISENYKSIKIGNHYWMTENLDVDCYLNGDSIPEVQNPKDWENLKTGAWCYYDNNPENRLKYGKIYNWFAINDKRGLAPKGFKVAGFEDWKTLFENLDERVAGYKLKSTHGWRDNRNGNNESKLNIYPAGFRCFHFFAGINEYTYFWTSTEENEKSAVFVNFNYYADNVFCSNTFKYSGCYVRCIKI